MKKDSAMRNFSSFSLFLTIFFAAAAAQATPDGFTYNTRDAGAVIHKSEKKTLPSGTLEPSNNLTGVMDITSPKLEEEDQEVYFSADEMQNDQELSTITALGNVNIVRDNLTVKADKIIYNQKDDVITAVGNVVLMEQDGSVVFTDYVVLTDKMKAGEMDNIKVIMKDKSQIAARKVKRYANDNKLMEHAVYSPCDVCTGKDPLWQLKARKIRHNAEKKDIYYNDAFLEIKGVPVFYTPFLSHPDPTVKRRSGFLTPSIESSSYLGAAIQPRYFWNISDHEDLLFSPIFTTDKGIVLDGKYNKFFYRGNLNAEGSFLRDKDDNDSSRGALFVKGRYEVNDYWLADADINYSSDRTYLKDMSLPKEDDAWLTSSLRMQGFDNRNYASIESYYYQLISYDMKEYDKPMVLPLLNYENISDVGRYGAYSKTNLNFASVFREEETNSQRFSMINSWVLPYTSPYGEKYRMIGSVKSDLYYVDNYTNPEGENFDGGVARIFPQLGLEWKLPFIRATETSRQILEPTIVAVAAPNNSNKTDKIPNEDSQDVELDDTNILDLDRYSGYDRNDTGSRISYGLNWSAYGDITGRTSAFFAQSYRFDKNESFARTSDDGNGYFSDYVGRVYAAPNEYFDLNYRFRMDKESLDMNYSELSTTIGPKLLNAYISYIYLQDNQDSSLIDGSGRKELYTSLNAELTKDWSVNIYNRQDLTNNGGSLEHGGSLIYEDECLKLIMYLRKDNSSDPDYEGDFKFGATFLLKTLGGTGK